MYCGNCGAKNSDTSEVCVGCNMPLLVETVIEQEPTIAENTPVVDPTPSTYSQPIETPVAPPYVQPTAPPYVQPTAQMVQPQYAQSANLQQPALQNQPQKPIKEHVSTIQWIGIILLTWKYYLYCVAFCMDFWRHKEKITQKLCKGNAYCYGDFDYSNCGFLLGDYFGG